MVEFRVQLGAGDSQVFSWLVGHVRLQPLDYVKGVIDLLGYVFSHASIDHAHVGLKKHGHSVFQPQQTLVFDYDEVVLAEEHRLHPVGLYAAACEVRTI